MFQRHCRHLTFLLPFTTGLPVPEVRACYFYAANWYDRKMIPAWYTFRQYFGEKQMVRRCGTILCEKYY